MSAAAEQFGRQPAGACCAVAGCTAPAWFAVTRELPGPGLSTVPVRVLYCPEHYSVSNRFNAERLR